MARLRIRIKLNPGGVGAQLDKLAEVSSKTDQFLRLLANDVNLPIKKGDLVAVGFENSSVSFDVEYVGVAEERQVNVYNTNLEKVVKYGSSPIKDLGPVRPQTLASYAAIADPIASDEKIDIGIYNGEDTPKWNILSKTVSKQILETLHPIHYEGAIQAIIHSAVFEGKLSFKARELSSELLITCYAPESLYEDIMKTLESRGAVVHIYGTVRASRITKQIEEINVRTLRKAAKLTRSELDQLWGSAPNFTGTLSTEAYIDRLREDGPSA